MFTGGQRDLGLKVGGKAVNLVFSLVFLMWIVLRPCGVWAAECAEGAGKGILSFSLSPDYQLKKKKKSST